jgi:K+-sensing histidine kinase KdpD
VSSLSARQRRTLSAAVRATGLGVAVLAVYPLLPQAPAVRALPYYGLLALGALPAVAIPRLPWQRLVERGHVTRVLYAWSVLHIVVITALVAVGGGPASPLVLLYALSTVFFAAGRYPAVSQLLLLGLTVGAFLILAAGTGWELGLAGVFVVAGLLGTLAYFTAFLSRELQDEAQTTATALADSRRRAAMLATVAETGRQLASLEPQAVLDAMIDAVVALGWDAASLCLLDETGQTYLVAHGRNLPDGYVGTVQPSDRGVAGMVFSQRKPVHMDDYSSHPQRVPQFRTLKIQTAIGVPVWLRGEMQGALIGGAHEDRPVLPEDVEALELLAAQAGIAIDNARAVEQERHSADALAEVDRLKGEFLVGTSHELRTPLAVVAGMGRTLEERWDQLGDAERLDLVRRMNAHADSLERILANVTDFSSLHSGALRATRAAVPVTVLVHGAIARASDALVTHEVSVDVESGVEVDVDGALVGRALENLLRNAATHTPPGTAVRISATPADDTVSVSVADDGPGIPAEEVAQLGEDFFRGGSPDERPAGGLGLGLALAYQVAALHGSELTIRSEPGQGSVFSLHLPRVVRSR